MDNFNALSKSAILTKLALDGYFIDLLTLNSFIEKWHIEAIYENEFGIEFFDNNSYLAILNNLKDKYNQTKENFGSNIKTSTTGKQNDQFYNQPAQVEQPQTQQAPAENPKQPVEQFQNEKENLTQAPETYSAPETQVQQEQTPVEQPQTQTEEPQPQVQQAQMPIEQPQQPVNENSFEDVQEQSLDELAQQFNAQEAPQAMQQGSVLDEHMQENIQFDNGEDEEITDSIMPMAMRKLTPGPVTPNSTVPLYPNSDDEFMKSPKPEFEAEDEGDFGQINQNTTQIKNEQTPEHSNQDNEIYDAELTDILEGSFTQEEIQKANKLMGKSNGETPKAPVEEEKNPYDDMDLIQLAQNFARNLTKGAQEQPEPANLDQIFEDSYTESFESLQEDTHTDTYDIEETPKEAPKEINAQPQIIEHHENNQPQQTGTNLTSSDIREIIREEMARQLPNLPANQNTDMQKMIQEIVHQTTAAMPQNAFKLDISNRTLDMVAKAIAKKIAMQLNDYYKLNITKQNSKLELFREKTLQLKEKYVNLSNENKKLKMLLLETNRNLNSYKPTWFGLYKFESKKKHKKK